MKNTIYFIITVFIYSALKVYTATDGLVAGAIAGAIVGLIAWIYDNHDNNGTDATAESNDTN